MSDPTLPVIAASFALSVVVLLSASLIRRPKTAGSTVATIPTEDSIYAPPMELSGPPPIPVGRVATWIYKPMDWLGIGVVFFIYAGMTLASLAGGKVEMTQISSEALVISIFFQFFMAGMVTAFVVTRINALDWLGLRWKDWTWVFLIAPATVFLMWMFFGGLQVAGYMDWVESLGVESVQDTVKLLQTSQDPVLLSLMAVAAVIAAPLCEEIVFRGYFYSVAKRFAGPWAAGFSSALFFSAAHGSLAALLPLFVFGGLLAWLYEKTGSLWAPIAVHFCFNGATVLVQGIARFYDIPLDGAQ
jgi:membrane protease YdiL (CAAX protease family)